MRVERPRWQSSLLGLGLGLVLVLSACSSQQGAPAEEPQLSPSLTSEATPLDVSGAELWLSFDDPLVGYDGAPEYQDAQGEPFAGHVVTANGGAVAPATGPPGRGQAVGFPTRCEQAVGCPRALIEVPPDPSLEPGAAAFTYGASVRLPPDQTSVGSNIVQSGRFGSSNAQWKLQVDGDDGQPSCIMRSDDDVLKIRSNRSIADDDWHRVVCHRDGRGIAIEVDGSLHRKPARSGSIVTGEPIRIGSPGVGDHDDQFHGLIDDVVLDIEPESGDAARG